MKKIYAFLAASLVAGSAFAAAPRMSRHAMQPEQLNANAAVAIEQAHQNIMNGVNVEKFAVKSQKAGEDVSWYGLAALNKQRFIDLISADRTFDESPYYWYTVTFSGSDRTDVVWDIIIPCIAVLEHDTDDAYWTGNEQDGYEFNWDMAAETYGSKEEAQKAPSFDLVCQYMGDNGQGQPYMIPMYPYGYLSAYSAFMSNPSTYQGTRGLYIRGGSINADNTINYDEAGKLYLKSYDSTAGDFEGAFLAPLGTIAQSGQSYVFSQLVATVKVDDLATTMLNVGFAPSTMTVGEVHIFNLGAADQNFQVNADYTLGDLYEEFKPAQMYYAAFCSPELTFEGQIEEATLPQAPAAKASLSIDNVNWFIGHFTLEANDDPENKLPGGIATLKGYTLDDIYIADAMEPGIAFSAYYLTKSADTKVMATLGFAGQFYDQQAIPFYNQDNKTGAKSDFSVFGIGDKSLGFNGNINSDMGAQIQYSYTGKVNYHYDPLDYTKSKQIDAVGNYDAGTLSVEGIAIESLAPVVATDYYNFQGIRLNEAPEHGIYIVREYKADGSVVSRKVVK